MRILSAKEFKSDYEGNLYFGGECVCSLVPHDTYPDMYHLKFAWRDEKTPEFFNGHWAKENARYYSRLHYQEKLYGAPQSDLNKELVHD